MPEANEPTVPCPKCNGTLRYYNIGFDDGYQCDRCKSIYDVCDKTGRRRDWLASHGIPAVEGKW